MRELSTVQAPAIGVDSTAGGGMGGAWRFLARASQRAPILILIGGYRHATLMCAPRGQRRRWIALKLASAGQVFKWRSRAHAAGSGCPCCQLRADSAPGCDLETGPGTQAAFSLIARNRARRPCRCAPGLLDFFEVARGCCDCQNDDSRHLRLPAGTCRNSSCMS